jgi:hypothetical protein
LVIARSHVQLPRTDLYYYTGKEALKLLTQADILRETLHLLTGYDDPTLFKALRGRELLNQPSVLISNAL